MTAAARIAALYLPSLPVGMPPQMVAGIRDAALRAFLAHGAAAFEAPRETTIMHETGHGIVGAAEGFRIRELRIFQRSARVWGGRCEEADATWSTGPDSSAEDDLRRARFTIGGLAAEALCGRDKPGSSLDELVLSQVLGMNAGGKLGDPTLSDEAHHAYVQRLWHEQVWGVALADLRANREPFCALAELLNQHERIKGEKLAKMLGQVKRRTS
jgi:hypothetical protein